VTVFLLTAIKENKLALAHAVVRMDVWYTADK